MPGWFFRFVSPQGRVKQSASIGSHSADEDGNEIGHDEMAKQLSELQCDQSANAEICQIVSHRYKSLFDNRMGFGGRFGFVNSQSLSLPSQFYKLAFLNLQ